MKKSSNNSLTVYYRYSENYSERPPSTELWKLSYSETWVPRTNSCASITDIAVQVETYIKACLGTSKSAFFHLCSFCNRLHSYQVFEANGKYCYKIGNIFLQSTTHAFKSNQRARFVKMCRKHFE